jgi:hypothetical protein
MLSMQVPAHIWATDGAQTLRGLRGPPSTSPTQVVDSPGPTDIASKGGPPLTSPTHVVASPGPISTAFLGARHRRHQHERITNMAATIINLLQVSSSHSQTPGNASRGGTMAYNMSKTFLKQKFWGPSAAKDPGKSSLSSNKYHIKYIYNPQNVSATTE